MRQEAYRVAFDEANWELKDIVGQFDGLRARKDQIERVVEVLKPFVSFGGQIAGSEQKAGDQTLEAFQQRFDSGKVYGSPQTRGIRQEAYRMAFDEASTELKEFVLKFEQLRFRKEQIEQLVDVLRPLLGQGASLSVVEPGTASVEQNLSSEAQPEVAQSEVSSMEATQQAEENPPDPFQRRGEAPVSVAAGGKDLRDYSRLFSSSLHRR